MFEGESNVLKAGINEAGRVTFLLKDIRNPSLFERWYLAPQALQREYLAVAMTAITSNVRVFVKLKNEGVDGSEASYFGIVKSY